MEKELNKDSTQREKCLLCGKETEYFISTPIQERLFYIEGGRAILSRLSL